MYSVATLANKNALQDLKVFLFTLQLWNETDLPTIYVYCDKSISKFLDTQNLYTGTIHKRIALDNYDNLTRKQMERMPGKEFKTLWEDLMCEKMNLLDWVHENESSVLFCDADICFLGPLPMVPNTYILGLSDHEICTHDTNKFGVYNGGFVFSANKDIPSTWRNATHSSRYFEQAALEDLKEKYSTYKFSTQNNYGWWRLLQGNESMETLKKSWGIKRNITSSGITVYGEPLLSIHTHWNTNDVATKYFNNFVLGFLEKLKSVEKTKRLLVFLKKL